MIDKIELFGKEIKLTTHSCHLFDQPAEEIDEPYVNFYIRTKFCNAKCAFCTYADDANKLSLERLEEVFKEITSKIKIRKVAVSGGEPTLYWDNFVNITNMALKWAPDSELSMNTDGFRWKQLFESSIYKHYHYIQLSRHHYDQQKNDEVFKCKTPGDDDIRWASDLQTHPHQIQFRCNLIKNYIDTKEEAFKFLEWSNSVRINDVGLVSLMPINDYSKENYIYFHIKELIYMCNLQQDGEKKQMYGYLPVSDNMLNNCINSLLKEMKPFDEIEITNHIEESIGISQDIN